MKYIAYYSAVQNRDAVERFVNFNHGTLVTEYVEKGKWPYLLAAIEKCRKMGATLVISELGRLVRSPRFLAILQDSGVSFACLDNHFCNNRTIDILAATVNEEAETTRQRVREVAAVAKANGAKLGSARPGHWEGREHLRDPRKAIAASAALRRTRARQIYEYLLPTMKEMRQSGKTMDEIAVWLNDHGHRTLAGGQFTQVSVWRVLKRYFGSAYLGRVRDAHGQQRIIPAMEVV